MTPTPRSRFLDPALIPRGSSRSPAERRRPSLPAVLLLALFVVLAVRPAGVEAQPAADGRTGEESIVPVDSTVVTEHQVTIGGEQVPYRATTGTQPVLDDDGQPVAALHYTFYERTDVQNREERPLVISFNGGPGSASVWMHLGYTGPRLIRIDEEGFPVFPYGVVDNEHSILDVADIVYVNPVNTGFSRMVGDPDRDRFFGVNEDIAYLAEWIDLFVSRNDRWLSPKFLIGESYGTTRVSGLAGALQGRHWMFLNGVILVSPTGLGVERSGPVGDALMLPAYAATAWYHDALGTDLQGRDLEEYLAEVEAWTLDTYLPALARGGSLPETRRREIAGQVARYTGLGEQFVLDYNLSVPVSAFRKELLRDQGLTVGRLDARYRGRDRANAGESYDYDPALTAWNQSFAPAINHYLRDELGWDPDLQYWLFGPVNPWNRQGDRTGEMLRSALAENPFLHVLVQSGYFDTGTDYFSAKYTMWNMDPRGAVQDRMRWIGYPSGHMMYLREDDLATSNQDIRDFIQWAMEGASGPAQY